MHRKQLDIIFVSVGKITVTCTECAGQMLFSNFGGFFLLFCQYCRIDF